MYENYNSGYMSLENINNLINVHEQYSLNNPKNKPKKIKLKTMTSWRKELENAIYKDDLFSFLNLISQIDHKNLDEYVEICKKRNDLCIIKRIELRPFLEKKVSLEKEIILELEVAPTKEDMILVLKNFKENLNSFYKVTVLKTDDDKTIYYFDKDKLSSISYAMSPIDKSLALNQETIKEVNKVELDIEYILKELQSRNFAK